MDNFARVIGGIVDYSPAKSKSNGRAVLAAETNSPGSRHRCDDIILAKGAPTITFCGFKSPCGTPQLCA